MTDLIRKHDALLGYHILPPNRRLRHGDGRRVIIGETISVKGPIELCAVGLHACWTIYQTVQAWEQTINTEEEWQHFVFCRVLVWGDVETGSNKFCGSKRMVLWTLDIKNILPPAWTISGLATDIAVLVDMRKKRNPKRKSGRWVL